MTWHAIEGLTDAYPATRSLLTPVRVKTWLILAIVVFFVSGTTGFNPSLSFNLPSGLEFDPAPTVPPFDEFALETTLSLGIVGQISPIEILIGLFIVGLVIVVGLLLFYLAAVFEFVFVDIATMQDIRIRGFFGASTGKGLSLFLFRLAVGFAILALMLLAVFLTIVTFGIFLIFLLLLSPLLILFALGIWVVLRFTTDFVVPIMLAEDVGIVEGWQRLWSEMRAEWRQYGMYALVRAVLGIAASLVVSIGAVAIALVLLIPFGLIGLIGYLLMVGVVEPVAIAFVVGVAALYIIAVLIAVVTIVQVPVQTYLRYYSLFVLGAISPAYDLVADLREEAPASVDGDGGASS